MLPLRNLTRYRRAHGVTREQLAVNIGTSSSMLRILETGNAGKRRDALIERIATELGCSVLELYGLQSAEDDEDEEASASPGAAALA